MFDFVTSIGANPFALFLIFVASSIVFTLLYKKYVVSIFDPLVGFIVAMSADTCLMFALPWQLQLKLEYAFFALCVWSGFVLSARTPQGQSILEFNKRKLVDLEMVLVLLCAVVVIANVYMGISSGFPLLNSNPSAAKVTVYTGGLGLVRRINMSAYKFLCAGCVYLAAVDHKKKLMIILLLITTAFISLSGAKGALVSLLYIQALVFAHPGLNLSRALSKKMKKYMLLTFIAGAGVGLTVTIKDQGNIWSGVQALFLRVLLTGDGILYYYGGRERMFALTQRSLAGYLDYLTNGSLAMLRLQDYKEALGSVILGTGNNGYGPNAQCFLRADLFFGPVWGCLYSMVIGYVIGFLRTYYFRAANSSPMLFVIKLVLAVSALDLFMESELFVSSLVMTFLFVFPLWLVARLVPRKSGKRRRSRPLESSLAFGTSTQRASGSS